MTITDTIDKGIRNAYMKGLTKSYDIAISVNVALRDEGYKIVCMSDRDIKTRNQENADLAHRH